MCSSPESGTPIWPRRFPSSACCWAGSPKPISTLSCSLETCFSVRPSGPDAGDSDGVDDGDDSADDVDRAASEDSADGDDGRSILFYRHFGANGHDGAESEHGADGDVGDDGSDEQVGEDNADGAVG